MKALVGLFTVFIASSLTQAADFRDAATICESMSFDSNKASCFKAVRQADQQYFDRGAIEVCRSMSFDSGKLECVSNIAGKAFESFEISNCANQSFDNKKNQCLINSGVAYREQPNRPGPRPPHYPPRPQNPDYVNGVTASWENLGVFVAPKAVTEQVTLNINTSRAVTEIRLATNGGGLRVVKAYAITASGQHVELRDIEGTYGKNSVTQRRLDPYYALRLQRIVLEISSTQLVGSRAKLEVLVGLTR
ncbi:hypothetical protein [Bdellovibrio sp.]|uniref:hypothetical protein n=1 Tax=Bdellovibrio sp. TaxID=28201 RepID=UPI0039E4E21D